MSTLFNGRVSKSFFSHVLFEKIRNLTVFCGIEIICIIVDNKYCFDCLEFYKSV